VSNTSPKPVNITTKSPELDEILPMSQAFQQGDEATISSGLSQSQTGDEQFVIVQYLNFPLSFILILSRASDSSKKKKPLPSFYRLFRYCTNNAKVC
jgi:hypothetical protein